MILLGGSLVMSTFHLGLTVTSHAGQIYIVSRTQLASIQSEDGSSMLVKRDINHHRSVKVKVGAVSTCPIPSVQISFIISQPCNQLNCIGQQCNLMGMYRCTVHTTWYVL